LFVVLVVFVHDIVDIADSYDIVDIVDSQDMVFVIHISVDDYCLCYMHHYNVDENVLTDLNLNFHSNVNFGLCLGD